jgi:hypothetical protein
MNPTSSLITGGVLLFGALALANILLPTPSDRARTELESPVAASIETDPAASATIEPAPVVKAPVVVETAPSPPAPIPSVPTPKDAAPPAKAVLAKPSTTGFLASIVARAKEMTRSSLPKSKEAPTADAAAAPIVSAPTPTVSLVTQPAPAAPSDGGAAADAFHLSATLQDRAWIRIGDHKTIMAKKDDVVPGLGKIASVDKDSITLDNGQVLKVAP